MNTCSFCYKPVEDTRSSVYLCSTCEERGKAYSPTEILNVLKAYAFYVAKSQEFLEELAQVKGQVLRLKKKLKRLTQA